MEHFILKEINGIERDYTYSQSSQIRSMTGNIGYLRADLGSLGTDFYSTWNDFRSDLKTEEFKSEFDDLINQLREPGNILSDRKTLSKFCYEHPDAANEDFRDFFFRGDTMDCAYLFRLNPNRGEYNLYLYVYQKDSLNHHLQESEQGIRFIDPNYNELFRIPDGGKIVIAYPDGTQDKRSCRFIDAYHAEIGNNTYHICEFAERMSSTGAIVSPAVEKVELDQSDLISEPTTEYKYEHQEYVRGNATPAVINTNRQQYQMAM